MDPRPVSESIVTVSTDVSTHSASVETDKATLAPNVGLDEASEYNQVDDGVYYRRDTGYASHSGYDDEAVLRTPADYRQPQRAGGRSSMDYGRSRRPDVDATGKVAGERTTSIDGSFSPGASLGRPSVASRSPEQLRATEMSPEAVDRHVTFRRQHRQGRYSSSSSSPSQSPYIDRRDRPHRQDDRPDGPVSGRSRVTGQPDRPVTGHSGRSTMGNIKSAASSGPSTSTFDGGERSPRWSRDYDPDRSEDRPSHSSTTRQDRQHSSDHQSRGRYRSSSSSSGSSADGRRRRRRHETEQSSRTPRRQKSSMPPVTSPSDVQHRRSSETRRSGKVRGYTDSTSENQVRGTTLPTLKLGQYDGSTCLETFLAKFENCSDYYNWRERERLCHLRAALDGGAGQVLWDAGRQSSVDEIIRLLKNRFGTQNQDERYRAELRARKRRKEESLQAVYHDVRRLMALAFPGQSGSLWEIMARDSFLDALGDSSLRLRVLEREPSGLDEALKIACRLEALGKVDSEELWDDLGRRRDRNKIMAVHSDPGQRTEERIKKLEATVEQYKSELEACKRQTNAKPTEPQAVSAMYGGQWMPPVQNSYSPYGYVPNGQMEMGNRCGVPELQNGLSPVDVNQLYKDNRNIKSKLCFSCGQPGHYRRNCPARVSRANGATVGKFGRETYLQIAVAGRKAVCLLDTGCERSMLPKKFVPKVSLKPVEIDVYAANGAKIPIEGSVRLQFQVEDMFLEAELLVSDAIEEMMLGIDWLQEHRCHWMFDENAIVIHGRKVALQSRATKAFVRRIYVAEEIVVPPRSTADVPVKMVWNSFRVPTSDWVTEPHQLTNGVYAARMLLPQDKTKAAVRVLNVSDSPYTFKEETCMGGAKPAVAWDTDPGLVREAAPPTRLGQRDVRSTCAGRGADRPHGQGTDRPPWRVNQPGHLGGSVTGQCDDRPHGQGTDRPPWWVGDRPAWPGTQSETQASKEVNAACFNGESEHLQAVVDALPDDLTSSQRAVAEGLVYDHQDVFSRSDFDLGRSNLVPHRIDTGDARPFKEQLRRHPLAHLDYIDQQVDQMLRADVIEPCASPWSSNVVLAKKSDGTLRFCVDYRHLNDLTYKDSYPLPRVDSCLDALGGSKYFSVLDLRSGFWQVTMDARDSDKTAFVTRRGQFRFKVLSFGLANSPSVFQRLMDLVLAGMTWETCLVYIDDVIVFSKTFDEHVVRLSAVLQRIRNAGLKLKPSKCRLFQRRVVFLGHVLSDEGIEPDPEKVAAVVNWPVPTNLTEVRAFLGLASYYRTFIKDFSKIAAPLHELSKKGHRFMWDERRQLAFEALKDRLTSAPVLAAPDSKGLYVLDVDASDVASGAILHQVQENELKVIAYASRLFDQAERKYCTTRKELAAVVFGLKRFRQYVLGRRLVVRSDHAALSHLRRTKDPVAQQARWLDFIEQFDVEIKYRSGPAHRNADALSRRPCEMDGACGQCNRGQGSTLCHEPYQAAAVKTRRQTRLENEGPVDAANVDPCSVQDNQQAMARDPPKLVRADYRPLTVCLESDPLPALVDRPQWPAERCADEQADGQQIEDCRPDNNPGIIHKDSSSSKVPSADAETLDKWSVESLRKTQRLDQEIRSVVCWLELRARPPWDEVKHLGREAKNYWTQWESLILKDGIVYRQFVRPDGVVQYLQLLVPQSLRKELLQMVHVDAAGHLGVRKTQDQVRRRAYWTAWRTDTELYCKCCVACNQYHRGAVPRQAPLQKMRVGWPSERWQIDLTGPHVPVRGLKYIMTAMDSFTKYVVAVPIRDKTAISVARAFVQHVVLKFGTPCSVLSDLGTEFQNELWTELCRLLNIQRLKTTAYSPSTNGGIERRTKRHSMNSMLGKVVDARQKDWPDHLPYVVVAYNSTVHDATSFSPNFLTFGRELPMAVDIVLGNVPGEHQTVNDYATHLVERMESAYELVRQCLGKAAESNKARYDMKARLVTFEVGDKVWLYNPKRPPGVGIKWHRCYGGPYTVVRRVNDVNYVVQLTPRSRLLIVHVNKLKKVKLFAEDGRDH